MRIIFFLLCLLPAQALFGQAKPNFFPEDISHEVLEIRCYCKPGVRNKSRAKGLEISYTWLGGGTFREEEGILTPPLTEYGHWQRIDFDIKAPVINKDHLKVLLGYKHHTESFAINTLGADFTETFRELGATNLKNNNLSLIVSKPLNETKYLAFRVVYALNGNYSGLFGFGNEYAVYKALGLFGIKSSEDFEWGFGASFSRTFRRASILPFLLYNRNFGNRWGVESVFPAYIYLRHNLKPGTILLLGTEYNSDSYRMKVNVPNNDELDYALNHSEIIGTVQLEQQISPWVWANAKVGFQMNFRTDFESKALTTTPFNVEPTNGLFLQFGVFISPPDKYF
jgi:hypothetical protein